MNIDEDKYPSLEDLKVDRDENGEIVPVKGKTPMDQRPIVVKPMPSGAFNEYFGDVMDAHDITDENKAKVFSKYYVRPDLSDVDAETIKNDMVGRVVNDLLEGLIAYSGMMDDGELMQDEEDGDNPNN